MVKQALSEEKEIISTREYLYVRVGYDAREMELLPDHQIGRGRARCEKRWRLVEEDGCTQLALEGEEGIICRLAKGNDGIWRGRWCRFERMPTELRPLGEDGPGSTLASDARGFDIETSDVDIVYTWVDGSDPFFVEELSRYKDEQPDAANDIHASGTFRFRDNGELRHSLRSVEQFAPWVRHIFVVTNGQRPPWLNTDHPKISIIPHESIYPNRAHLPTFNSCSIECHLHRIPGLAEAFVYFNDDHFLGRPVTKRDFYSRETGHIIRLERWGISPLAEERPIHDEVIWQSQHILDERFGPMVGRKNTAHAPFFMIKSVFQRMVETWPEAFDQTSSQRFRSAGGISPVYLYTYFVMHSNLPFRARIMHEHTGQGAEEYHFGRLDERDLGIVLKARPKFFALNDSPGANDAPPQLLDQCFPSPSSFEL